MSNPITIELFYTITCPNCKIVKKLLDDVLVDFKGKFKLKQTNASMPLGMVKTMKLGIHSVPTLLINNEIAFRSVPTKQELVNKLNYYLIS
ncbi:MAG: thioredoxin family protein [Bacteroidales bacterium]